MLPGIKEDESANFSSFQPKQTRKHLFSSRKAYADLLQRKLKQLRAGPKIKVPEALIWHMKRKRMSEAQTHSHGFPCLQDMMNRIKSLSASPQKIRNEDWTRETEKNTGQRISPMKSHRFKLNSAK
jgi:hypothetical protein